MTAVIITALMLLLLLSCAAAWLLWRRIGVLKSQLNASESRAREIGEFLARFSTAIQGESGVAGAMRGSARHVAEQIDAETVVIYETQDDRLIPLGVWSESAPGAGEEIDCRRDAASAGAVFAAEIARKQRPDIVIDAACDDRFSDSPDAMHSVMGVPLVREGRCVGVLCAFNDRHNPEQRFSEAQFDRLKLLAHQVLLAHKIALAYQEISRRDRIDQELGFVRGIQMSLLPDGAPQWGCFSIAASTRSAKEVDGDFYDFVRIDADRMLVLLGDACGKGMPACMLTAMARSFARSLADNFTTLTDFLRELNKKLHRDIDADRFITVGCCLLDRRNSLLEFGRAGHTEMVTFVHNHIRVFSPEGAALGILPDEFAEFESICIALDPGTTVLLFSDGITEATDASGSEFGIERLTRTFSTACEGGMSIRAVLDAITGAVSEFEQEQNDDQTLVVIRQTDDVE